MAYDLSRGGDGLRVRTLSAFDLERQIGSDGATWLDRELVAPTPLGFGRDVMRALDRRAQRLVGRGQATLQTDGSLVLPRNLVAALERQEVERIGQEMAKARGLTFQPAKAGEYVRGTLAGSTNLASGRYAMIDDGLGFSLVPWQPVLDQRIGPTHRRRYARRRRYRVEFRQEARTGTLTAPKRLAFIVTTRGKSELQKHRRIINFE
jgi:hypothetical protein